MLMYLAIQHIHLWYIALDIEIPVTEELSLLSNAEQQQANSFHFAKDKKNYIVRHIALRNILGQYCRKNPAAINFGYTSQQKPYIAEENIPNLQFNMSSSHNTAILAITRSAPIGVDIEFIKPMPDINDIVEEFFSQQEKKDFFSLPEQQRLNAFYTIWTSKEAFIKASGEGLAYPLDRFEVEFLQPERVCILKINNSLLEAKKWALNSFMVNFGSNNYKIAIITKSVCKKIYYFYYPQNLKVSKFNAIMHK